MNAREAPQGGPPPFVFSSPEGFSLCRRILKESLPYDPHDFQIEGICKAFDRVDLNAILATGTGKGSRTEGGKPSSSVELSTLVGMYSATFTNRPGHQMIPMLINA